MDQDSLLQAYTEANNALEEARARLAKEQEIVAEAEQRLRLLEGLMALGLQPGHGTMVVAPEQGPSEDLVDAVVRLLKERGAPMHIAELRTTLLMQGIPLPGRGDDANLIAKLQRSKGRVVRVGRGLYDITRVGSRAQLVFADGRRVALPPLTRLGRSDECEIVLADSRASRLHATIETSEGLSVLTDNDSINGTVVNGRPVESVELADGDVITIGHTNLRFTLLED